CMFTMMNQARLAVGIEGVGIAERAYQQALAYAQERKQGRGATADSKGSDAIIVHPDIRRMLMQMRTLTAAARAICYATAVAMDISHRAKDAGVRGLASARAALLTPIAKAFSTDIGNEVASLGVQVHGGMGFIEETGAAQHLRDARITTIYEGTTGIQANDLIGRKIAREGGATAKEVIGVMRAVEAELGKAAGEDMAATREAFSAALTAAEECVSWMVIAYGNDIKAAHAGAVPFLTLMGIVCGGWQMARAALVARQRLSEG